MEIYNYVLWQCRESSIFVACCMFLVVLLVDTIGVIFKVTSLYGPHFFLYEKRRGYARVVWMAITTIAEKYILRYTAEDRWLIIFEVVPFYWYLYWISRHFRIPVSKYVSSHDRTLWHIIYWIYKTCSVIWITSRLFIVITKLFENII